MHGTIPPPDEGAHEDSVLIAVLAAVNTMIARYILRLLDADAGRAAPISIEDERALVDSVADVLGSLRSRAERREHIQSEQMGRVLRS
jgi:hypothetical protein